jgi:cardiolipin synthase A/B
MKTFIYGLLVLTLTAWAGTIPDKSSLGMNLYLASKTLFGGADLKGHTLRSLGKGIYQSWKKIDQQIASDIKTTVQTDYLTGQYQQEFNFLTEALGATTPKVEFLVDGEASFAKRKTLIAGAKRSINLMVWAIYDDYTGKLHSDWLLEALRNNPDLKIRIMVDGPTSKESIHHQQLNRLMKESQDKIEVVEWQTKTYRSNGSHRKLFIVDEQKLIMGGLNVGDAYSHLNPEVSGWRDTDIFMEGDVVQKALMIFSKLWNEQIAENHLDVKAMAFPSQLVALGAIPVSLINHNPGSKNVAVDHHILTAYAKLIHDAKKTIDIENAYFIFNPVLNRVLSDALKRGVKVRLFTNSSESIDEPVVSAPVLKSAKKAFELGVDVYLRKGTTLHSKMMIIDGKVALIGSDNLHPRSQRFEGEIISVIFHEKTAQEMTAIFHKDISSGTHIRSSEEIVIKETLLSKLASLLFFDQL